MWVLPSYEGGRVERMAFTADGQWLITVASHPKHSQRNAPVRLWERFTGLQRYTQPVPSHYGRCLALAADGSVSAWDATTTRGTTLCLWDNWEATERYSRPAEFSQHDHLNLTRGGTAVVKRSGADRISFFSTTSSVVLTTERWSRVEPLPPIDYLPDPQSAGSLVNLIQSLLAVLQRSRGYGQPVLQMLLSGDQMLIATRHRGFVAVWSPPFEKERWTMTNRESPCLALALSPDQRTLAGAAEDGSISFWDVNDGRVRQRYQWDIGPLHSVAFAPDGLTCAAGGEDGRVVLWDLDE